MYKHLNLLTKHQIDPDTLPDDVQDDLADFAMHETSKKQFLKKNPNADTQSIEKDLKRISEVISVKVQKIIDETAKLKAEEEAEAKRKADEEAAAAAEAKRKADEEAAKLKAEQEAEAKRKADEEAAKLKAEQESEAKRKADEEAAAAAAAAEKNKKQNGKVGFFF